ncbi:MAG: hypothetical protein GXY41_04425 [Phycisphaerae bacterium]|nr:hypothetical protein [Phycisphaerae bacterium]
MESKHTSEPLLIGVSEFCRLTSISRALYFEKRAAGRIGPQEIRFGRKILLRADEVRDWVAASCPPRRAWRWKGGAK